MSVAELVDFSEADMRDVSGFARLRTRSAVFWFCSSKCDMMLI